MKPHTIKILEHLQTKGSITPTEALDEFGCFRLGARIYDLRQQGHTITTERVTEMNKPSMHRRLRGEQPRVVSYARYKLTN